MPFFADTLKVLSFRVERSVIEESSHQISAVDPSTSLGMTGAVVDAGFSSEREGCHYGCTKGLS